MTRIPFAIAYDVVNRVHEADDTVNDCANRVDVSVEPLNIPTVIVSVTGLVDFAHSSIDTGPGGTHLGAAVALSTIVQKCLPVPAHCWSENPVSPGKTSCAAPPAERVFVMSVLSVGARLKDTTL
jgi:hypothetical protein